MWVPSWDCQPAPRPRSVLRGHGTALRCNREEVQRQALRSMQLRESTKRAIMTHPNHDQKPARLDTDASLFSAGAIPLNKDASQQYVTSTHANERELLAVVEAPQVWCHRLEVAPSYFRSHGQDDHATNIQPDQRNRRINGRIEVLQAYPLVWRHLPVGLLSNPIYISSIRSNIRSNRTPATKNHVLGYKKGGLCL